MTDYRNGKKQPSYFHSPETNTHSLHQADQHIPSKGQSCKEGRKEELELLISTRQSRNIQHKFLNFPITNIHEHRSYRMKIVKRRFHYCIYAVLNIRRAQSNCSQLTLHIKLKGMLLHVFASGHFEGVVFKWL